MLGLDLTTVIVAIVSSGILSTVITIGSNHYKDNRDRNDIHEKALMFLMRCSIDQIGNKYIERGYASHNEKKELSDSFEVYKTLGGNGYIDSLMEEVMSLKTRKDD